MNDNELITAMRGSFTDVYSATPVEQIVSRSRVIRARRRIPGAVAVAAAAAGIAATVILSAPVKPAAQTTAYVVSHVAQALDAMPAGTILSDRMTYIPPGQGPNYYPQDTWSTRGQSRSETFTQAGQLVSDYGRNTITRATMTFVQVDYQNKTWWRSVHPNPGINVAGPRRPIKWTCSSANSDDIIVNPSDMADQLRTALSCGELKADGTGTVDGVATVKLAGNLGGFATTYWVNATTYLPVRLTSRYDKHPVLQDDLQWLPATAANLAKLNVPIPAGFTQVPPPQSPRPQRPPWRR